MNDKILQNRINDEVLEHFHRACIRELTEIDLAESKASLASIFERQAAAPLKAKTCNLGCKNFEDLVVPVDAAPADSSLGKVMRPHLEECEEIGLPTTVAEMKSLNLIGFLTYPGRIGFVDSSLDVQLWDVSGEELDFIGNPENLIVSRQPMLTFDLYGNLLGYTYDGVVTIFEGDGADWEFDWET